jgi:hypothetical protein
VTATPEIRLTPAGTLLITAGDEVAEFTFGEAEALAGALRDAVYLYAPEMRRVRGGLNPFTAEVRIAPPEGSVPASDVIHSLACPYPDCPNTGWNDLDSAVTVVDFDERWSDASYERTETADGTVIEKVSTGGANSDYTTIGYRCPVCGRPVRLPDGITEEWA